MSELKQAPVRLCCGQRHYGAVCPDGTFMCCICFGKFLIEQSHDGFDVCQECGEKES